jgi:putative heme-binding domain-containing protein
MSARPKEALLVDILDPSAQVTPDFGAYTIVLQDGGSVSGLIVVEDETRVTVRRPSEPDAVIPRLRIREIRAEGKSLMPDGLEEGLTLQDFADLLQFVAP